MTRFLRHTLDRVICALDRILHPTLLGQILNEVGLEMGHHTLQEFQTATHPQKPMFQEEFLNCINHFSKHGGWDYSQIKANDDQLLLKVPECPFGTSAAFDPKICQMESGFLGEIAGEAFGYAKVSICKGEGTPPRDCRITIYTSRTPESLAADGAVYSRDEKSQGGRISDPLLSTLSVRERNVLRLIAEGLSDKEIASSLNLSVRTAEGHIARIREKLAITGRADLIRYALRNKLVAL